MQITEQTKRIHAAFTRRRVEERNGKDSFVAYLFSSMTDDEF